MKKIITIALVLVLSLALATGCTTQDMSAWEQYQNATSHVEVADSIVLPQLKDFLKEGLKQSGVDVAELSISSGWMSGPYMYVNVYTSSEEYIRYEVEKVSGVLVAALDGDESSELELKNAFGEETMFENWKMEVKGERIVLIDPIGNYS